MPAGAIVAVSLVLTALLGLAIGAVWGLSGGSSAPTATPTRTTSPTTGATTPAPTSGSSSSTAPLPSPTESSAAPTATGSVPPAPATTTTSADGWRLGSWRITNSAGALGVETTARNTSTGTRSADLILFVYVNGEHIATTTTRVTDVPAGGTVPVIFTGTDPWKVGTKILLLQVG